MTKAIMVVGTSSHVGKSLLATALCRIVWEAGWKVAPFKSQNMSLNAAVTPDGFEIGRAQAVQARAAGIDPSPHMNPVLLKPTSRHQSQVVLRGVAVGNMEVREYFRGGKQALWEAIVGSYEELASRFDVIVIEGAGSPVEMNLKPNDLANMRVAEMADACVILVADIERGGVFASVVGTLQLLDEAERARVKGIVINKFRGDPQLFEEGKKWLAERTGVPVLGVIPHVSDLAISEEDSLGLAPRHGAEDAEATLRIGVVRLPHVANFTDFDPLLYEVGIHLVWVTTPFEMEGLDAVIVPGSKSTLSDMVWMRTCGLDVALRKHYDRGGFVLGICGGFQMLGERLEDPDQVESSVMRTEGLGLLAMETVMTRTKATRWVVAEPIGSFAGEKMKGYEMHMGTTRVLTEAVQPFARLTLASGEVTSDGAVAKDGRLVGTYLHHLFHNDEWRLRWLNLIRSAKGMDMATATTSFDRVEEDAIAHFAQVVADNMDIERLFALSGLGKAVEA